MVGCGSTVGDPSEFVDILTPQVLMGYPSLHIEGEIVAARIDGFRNIA
jgi:hypothetical protein